MIGSQPLGDNGEYGEILEMWLSPIFGSEGENAGTQLGGQPGAGDLQGNDGDSGDGDEDGQEDGEDGSDGDDDVIAKKDIRIQELSSEAAQRRRQLRAAEKERDEALAKFAAMEAGGDDGKIDDAARQQIEAPLLEKIEKMTNASRTTAIKNLILAEGQKDGAERRLWHSADNVLTQIDMTAIDYDSESGSIEGVSEELDRIAADQPFLIKEKGRQKKANQTKDEGEKESNGKRGASGKQPGGAGRQVQGLDSNRKKELGAKYPILNRR